MKSIAAIVKEGIQTPDQLHEALRIAMQLELSTLPPYLCAEWSIDPARDPSGVTELVAGIALQEMYHFALAGNILSAIGGPCDVARAEFVVAYPAAELPGGIDLKAPLDLRPLTIDQVAVFMDVERPEFTPIAKVALAEVASIGAFYDTIKQGIETVNPSFDPNARQIIRGDAVRIRSKGEADTAIDQIKRQGEGTPDSPLEDMPENTTEFAHYYRFKAIQEKHELKFENGKWGWTGAEVVTPGCFPFEASTASPSPSAGFNTIFTQMLRELEACWTAGSPFKLATMRVLATEGKRLIATGVCPEFKWAG